LLFQLLNDKEEEGWGVFRGATCQKCQVLCVRLKMIAKKVRQNFIEQKQEKILNALKVRIKNFHAISKDVTIFFKRRRQHFDCLSALQAKIFMK
jgi:hypothetical protein